MCVRACVRACVCACVRACVCDVCKPGLLLTKDTIGIGGVITEFGRRTIMYACMYLCMYV